MYISIHQLFIFLKNLNCILLKKVIYTVTIYLMLENSLKKNCFPNLSQRKNVLYLTLGKMDQLNFEF